MRWAPSCGLCGPGNRCEAWENGRHARAAQRGPRKIGQRYENVRRQSRELLYSIPARLNRKAGPAAEEHGKHAEDARFGPETGTESTRRLPTRDAGRGRNGMHKGCLLQQCCSYGPSKGLQKKLACRSEATRQIATKSRVRYVAAPWLQEQFWT